MANLNQIVAVVDDDESVCRAIKRLLRSIGIKAETFSSGEEFLGTLSSTASYRPACVILDFQMPGINGLELQRRLAPTDLPVIFITAHDDPAVREKALASGAAGYLRKPFNDAILLKAVEIALGATPIPVSTVVGNRV
ncbi:histidine kinase [Paraburkholderia phytofirmans OLGA172]|uniref:Histidine kinase n=1 Tax=Paraburkholderia phytofirmans OLGA172 TaxID=1417228 RepID=A0A160FKZ3_9BURK|nr:response regulator [Paraburkholderia phytofirmans]ANB72748.1 histidine kinase [Paraburkholderia phytofirmans OLGA172]